MQTIANALQAISSFPSSDVFSFGFELEDVLNSVDWPTLQYGFRKTTAKPTQAISKTEILISFIKNINYFVNEFSKVPVQQ